MGSYSCLEDLQPLAATRMMPKMMPSGDNAMETETAAGMLAGANPVGILWEVEQTKSAERLSGSGSTGGGVTCEGGGCDIVFASFGELSG